MAESTPEEAVWGLRLLQATAISLVPLAIADTRPYAMEVLALLMLLVAAASAAVDVHVLIDNRAVADLFACALRGDVWPRYGFGIWWAIRRAIRGRSHSVESVPSHGKRESWTSSAGLDSGMCRALNDAADKQASAATAHDRRTRCGRTIKRQA